MITGNHAVARAAVIFTDLPVGRRSVIYRVCRVEVCRYEYQTDTDNRVKPNGNPEEQHRQNRRKDDFQRAGEALQDRVQVSEEITDDNADAGLVNDYVDDLEGQDGLEVLIAKEGKNLAVIGQQDQVTKDTVEVKENVLYHHVCVST